MNSRSFFYNLALSLAIASGLFLLMLGGLLAYNEVRGKVSMLVRSKQVVSLHDKLRHKPKDDALKAQIRQLDLKLRRETFYRLQLSHNASRALLAGLAIFLASAHFVRTSRRKLPNPQAWGIRVAGDETRMATFARYAVAGGFALVGVASLIVSSQPVSLPERSIAKSRPPTDAAGPAIAAAPDVPAFPSPEEIQQQWPSFRGPNGLGVAPKASSPVTWKAKDGTNILWKTEISLLGMSSPIVWGDAIFLTGADKTQSCVYRFDSATGALQWSAPIKLPGGSPPAPTVGDETSLAAPTPVTDGQRVYALFPSGEIAAFDFSGKQVWARNIGPLENTYGYASSLAIYQDHLLIQIDRGEPEDGQSKLLALNTRTGKDLYDVKRDVAASWASPIIVNVSGQPQLITCAKPFVIAYNPADGKELWRSKCLESDVAPSPVITGNTMVVVAPNTAIIGLHPGEEAVAWQVDEGAPDATSPVSDGQRVYLITSEGQLTCYEIATGKVVWTHDFSESF